MIFFSLGEEVFLYNHKKLVKVDLGVVFHFPGN